MSDAEEQSPRTGSGADLARRVDRLEQRVDALTLAVSRVEANQETAEKLNELRFGSLDSAVKLGNADVASLRNDLQGFMRRMEGILTGEIETAQGRAGRELVARWEKWREDIESRMPDDNEVVEYRTWRKGVDQFVTQGKFLGRLSVLLIGGNAISLIVAIAALMNP